MGVGFAFEGPAEYIGIEQVPAAARVDARAGLGAAFDQTFGGEDADGLPIDCARDVKCVAGFDLAAENVAGLADATDDFHTDVMGNRAMDARRKAPDFSQTRVLSPE